MVARDHPGELVQHAGAAAARRAGRAFDRSWRILSGSRGQKDDGRRTLAGRTGRGPTVRRVYDFFFLSWTFASISSLNSAALWHLAVQPAFSGLAIRPAALAAAGSFMTVGFQ